MDIAELSIMLESMEPREVSEEEFMETVAKVKTMKNLPQEQQLILYGLFKQVTTGDNNAPKPDEADLVNKYKW
jgi:acyl-CoA-binding protein